LVSDADYYWSHLSPLARILRIPGRGQKAGPMSPPPRFVRNVSLVLRIPDMAARRLRIQHHAYLSICLGDRGPAFTPATLPFLTYSGRLLQVFTGWNRLSHYPIKAVQTPSSDRIVIRLVVYGFMMRLRGCEQLRGRDPRHASHSRVLAVVW